MYTSQFDILLRKNASLINVYWDEFSMDCLAWNYENRSEIANALTLHTLANIEFQISPYNDAIMFSENYFQSKIESWRKVEKGSDSWLPCQESSSFYSYKKKLPVPGNNNLRLLSCIDQNSYRTFIKCSLIEDS